MECCAVREDPTTYDTAFSLPTVLSGLITDWYVFSNGENWGDDALHEAQSRQETTKTVRPKTDAREWRHGPGYWCSVPKL